MPQPEFVPVRPLDNVRPDEVLPVPDEWRAERPAEIKTVFQPVGNRLGYQGPDQGYGLKLANRLSKHLKLTKGEHPEDAVYGCLAVGLKRAAIHGRAPVIYDMEHAYTLWGYLGDPPEELVEFRQPLFQAVAHHYEGQRAIADAVPESTLRLSHTELANRMSDWRELIDL